MFDVKVQPQRTLCCTEEERHSKWRGKFAEELLT